MCSTRNATQTCGIKEIWFSTTMPTNSPFFSFLNLLRGLGTENEPIGGQAFGTLHYAEGWDHVYSLDFTGGTASAAADACMNPSIRLCSVFLHLCSTTHALSPLSQHMPETSNDICLGSNLEEWPRNPAGCVAVQRTTRDGSRGMST